MTGLNRYAVHLSFALLTLNSTAGAQRPPLHEQSPEGTGPLEVVGMSVSVAHHPPRLRIAVRNKGERDMLGFCLVVKFSDAEKRPGGTIQRSVILIREDGTPNPLTPGQVISIPPLQMPSLPNGTPASYIVAVDYVFYADRSSWGPRETDCWKLMSARVAKLTDVTRTGK